MPQLRDLIKGGVVSSQVQSSLIWAKIEQVQPTAHSPKREKLPKEEEVLETNIFAAAQVARPARRKIGAKYTKCGSGTYTGECRVGKYRGVVCHKQKM